jgi:hypothetical protein
MPHLRLLEYVRLIARADEAAATLARTGSTELMMPLVDGF